MSQRRKRRRRIVLAVVLALLITLVTWCLVPISGGEVRGLTTVKELYLSPDSPEYFVNGHRGDFFRWRIFLDDNTIRSFERAIEQGADMVEIDISNTKDGTPIVIHSVAPREHTLDEWKAKGREFLLLSTVLDWADGKIVLMLDLKTKLFDRVIEVVRECKAEDRVVFLAGRESTYEVLKKGGDDLYLMGRPRNKESLDTWMAFDDPMIIIMHGDYDWLDAESVKRIRDSGRLVFANSYKASWNQEALGAGRTARMFFSAGINIVQTNCPASASRARDEAEAGARVAAARPE